MRFASARRHVGVQLPLADLMALLCLSEFRGILARFPKLIRVELLHPPYQIVLSATVIPFVMQLNSEAAVLRKMRRSLERIPGVQ